MFLDLNFSHNSPALVACIIYFVDSCFRYFVCGKYCDQGQLGEERVYFALWFQRDENLSWWGVMAASSSHGTRRRKLLAYILTTH